MTLLRTMMLNTYRMAGAAALAALFIAHTVVPDIGDRRRRQLVRVQRW